MKKPSANIHIDLNAGDHGSAMLSALAHELTHFIQDWSPAKYRILCRILMEGYAERGQSVNELILAKQAQYRQELGIELTPEQAYDEVIASSMESVLNDGEVLDLLDTIETKDKSLWEKFRSFIEEIADLIHRTIQAFRNVHPESPEGKIVERMTEIHAQLQQAFAEGLHEGGENYRTGGKENTAQEGGVKYSFNKSKNGMANEALLPYDKDLQEIFTQRGDIIINSADKLKNVVDLAFDRPTLKATAYFGIIAPEVLERIENDIENLPFELKGKLFKSGRTYSIASTLDSIRHLTDDKRSMTRKDVLDYLDRLADLIIEYDAVTYTQYVDNHGKTNNGVRFKKAFSDGTMVSVEIVSHKKRTLNMQTLFMDSASYQKKKAAETPLVPKTPAHTPKARVSQPSNDRVTQGRREVKKFSARYQQNEAAAQHLQQENSRMTEDVAALTPLVQALRKMNGGKMRTAYLAEAVAHLKKIAGARGNSAEFGSLLNDFYSYVTHNDDYT